MNNVVDFLETRLSRLAKNIDQIENELRAAILDAGFDLVPDGVDRGGRDQYALVYRSQTLVKAADDLEMFELFDLASELRGVPEEKWIDHALKFVDVIAWLRLGADA